MTDDSVQRLQMLEQNLQALVGQKQQVQAQMFEVESAQKELKDAKSAYKVIGGVMVLSDPQRLGGELKERHELLGLRVQTLEKQEQKLREQAKELQKNVLSSMKE